MESFFKKSIDVHRSGLIRPKLFLVRDGAIALTPVKVTTVTGSDEVSC